MNLELIKKIYIEKSLAAGVVAQSVRRNAPAGTELILVDDGQDVIDHYQRQAEEYKLRNTILLQRYRGKFLSACPGSDGVVCCNYFVLNTGVNCPFECHYCFLHSFLNSPLLTIAGNLDQMVEALDRALANPKVRFRIGTGEYTDSLVLEPLHGISAHLVKHFAQLNNATLELKTKSDAVGTLLDLDHRGHTVLAWSLNPQQIIDESEPYTASLDERLRAAQAAQAAGYPLAFHLDPIIYHDDWRRLYRELIVELFERIDPAGVVWISLGGFRYSGGHKEVMQSRFPEQRLTAAEMIQGSDGKFRYLKTIRREIYTTLRGWIEERDAKLFHYLCMETQGMWRTIYGAAPGSARELDRHFEERRCEVAARHK